MGSSITHVTGSSAGPSLLGTVRVEYTTHGITAQVACSGWCGPREVSRGFLPPSWVNKTRRSSPGPRHFTRSAQPQSHRLASQSYSHCRTHPSPSSSGLALPSRRSPRPAAATRPASIAMVSPPSLGPLPSRIRLFFFSVTWRTRAGMRNACWVIRVVSSQTSLRFSPRSRLNVVVFCRRSVHGSTGSLANIVMRM